MFCQLWECHVIMRYCCYLWYFVCCVVGCCIWYLGSTASVKSGSLLVMGIGGGNFVLMSCKNTACVLSFYLFNVYFDACTFFF